jgi:hypothetical protein
VVRQQREVARLEQEVLDSASRPAKAPEPSSAIAAAPSPAAPPAPVSVSPSPSVPPAPPPGRRQAPAGMFSGMSAMMTNPAMKEMIRAQTQAQLNVQYESLYSYLNQSPEQIAALKQLLMDRQLAMMESGLALMSGEGTETDRQRRVKEGEQIKRAFDTQIAELLGAEEYDVFQQYENTQHERTQVDMFKRTMSTTAEPLTEQQESDLVLAMYAARTNAALSHLDRNTAPDPSQLTREALDETLKQLNQMQARYAESAATILSPAQQAQFQHFMTQQQELNTLGLKMAEQMFGLGESPAAPARPGP